MKNEKMWTTIAICVLVGVVMMGLGARDYFSLKSAKNLSEVDLDGLKKNQVIRGTAEYVYDYYCYETKDGVETARWYLVPVIQGMDDLRYITVKVNAKLFNSYEMLYDATWDYLDGLANAPTQVMNYQGRLKPLNKDIQKQLDEYVEKSEYEDEWREMIIPFCVELTTTKGAVRNMIIGAIALVAAGVLFLIIMIRDKKEKDYLDRLHQGRISVSLNPSSRIDDSELDNLLKGDAVSKPNEPFTPYDPYSQANFTSDATDDADGETDDAQVLSTEDYAENIAEESDNEKSESDVFDNDDSNNGNWVL